MSFEKRDNSGVVSKNDRKDLETHPDIKGSALIDGKDYWISGWQKRNDRGTFYSLSFKAKEPASAPNGGHPDLGDAISFEMSWK